MANSLTTNPIVLDTEGAISALAETRIITAIEWCNEASDEIADGDIMELLHASGGEKIAYTIATGTTPKISWQFPGGLLVKGIYLNDLDSGYVFIYFK